MLDSRREGSINAELLGKCQFNTNQMSYLLIVSIVRWIKCGRARARAPIRLARNLIPCTSLPFMFILALTCLLISPRASADRAITRLEGLARSPLRG